MRTSPVEEVCESLHWPLPGVRTASCPTLVSIVVEVLVAKWVVGSIELISAIFLSAVPSFGICVLHVAHRLGARFTLDWLKRLEGVDLVRVRACRGVLKR